MRQTILFIVFLTAFDLFGATIKVTRVIDGNICETEITNL